MLQEFQKKKIIYLRIYYKKEGFHLKNISLYRHRTLLIKYKNLSH